MYKKIEIERFRGIRKASIDGFCRVNIFFGKNNCGKSSLLEALFLVSGQSNPLLPVNINAIRGYNRVSKDDLKINFFDMDSDQPIHIRIEDGETRDLNVTLIQSDNESVSLDTRETAVISSVADKIYGLQISFSTDGVQYASSLLFNPTSEPKDQVKQAIDSRYEESLHCTYLGPKFDFYASVQGLQNILKNKDEQFLIDGLKLIEPKVEDFIFDGNDIFVNTGLSKRIPINVMGDGARKIVALLTSVYACKDGILLIDEISNGFHHSVMTDLWRALIEAANKNNTQLFVTTHDIDSIKGLRNAVLDTDTAQSVAAYKLQHQPGGEMKAYRYTIDSVDYSLNQEIELR